MILVDTGPLVALFDRKDAAHRRCSSILKGLREPLKTTIPVLTEAFHMLGPASRESDRLRALWSFAVFACGVSTTTHSTGHSS